MAKIETVPFDTADFLNSPEDVAAYLDAYFEDGSPQELRAALDNVARSRGMSAVARASGISRVGVYKALAAEGNPSFETIRAVLGGMGLRLSVAPIVKEMEAA
jgi:probable addiction module antidote protein